MVVLKQKFVRPNKNYYSLHTFFDQLALPKPSRIQNKYLSQIYYMQNPAIYIVWSKQCKCPLFEFNCPVRTP